VVRAAAASRIPLISAVGHETDWTLIDYASDQRAPTPTGAAEMAVPVKADLEASVSALSARLKAAVGRQMDNRRQTVRALTRALPSLDQLLALPRRRFDEASAGLGRGLQMNTANKRRTFERTAAHLRPDMLSNRINERRQKLAERMVRAERIVERLIQRSASQVSAADASLRTLPARLLSQIHRSQDRLTGLSGRADSALLADIRRRRSTVTAHDRILQSLSYRNVLKRGYALVRDDAGLPIKSAAALVQNQAIAIEFADGSINALTTEGDASPPPQPVKRRAEKAMATAPPKQGSLF
jgi:exodeoxyribonuclease VII large subunit